MELKEQIISIMKQENKPLSAGEVSKLLNADKATVDKIFNQLKKEEIIYSPIRCKYKIKQ